MHRHWLILGLVLIFAAGTTAQTKLSGSGQCAKPHAMNVIDVPDRPHHAFSIGRVSCTWKKPFEFDGIQAKGGIAVQFDELSGNTSAFHGYFTDTMANGDEIHYSYEGNSTLKEGVPQTSTWKWTIAGGAGKFKGLRGEGTCKGSARADGGSTWDCEGEYQKGK